MSSDDDAGLIAATLAGDRRMFSRLYGRHVGGIYARLTRLVGPAPERDDLIQEIFLDAYRALPRFRGESTFATFLHRIAINVACEHLERRRRTSARSAPFDERLLDGLAASDPSPEARARHRQALARVFQCLETLSVKRRVAFVLVGVEALSLEEAGKLLGVSPDAVKQRVREARRELGKQLRAGDIGHEDQSP